MTGLLPLGKGLYTVQSFWGPFLLFFKLHKSTEQGHTPSELKARTGFCKSTWLGSLLQCDEWLEEVFQGLKTTSLWPFLWHFSHPFSSLNFWGCPSYLKGFTAKNSVETHHLLDLLWRTSYENTFCYQVIFFFFLRTIFWACFFGGINHSYQVNWKHVHFRQRNKMLFVISSTWLLALFWRAPQFL